MSKLLTQGVQLLLDPSDDQRILTTQFLHEIDHLPFHLPLPPKQGLQTTENRLPRLAIPLPLCTLDLRASKER